ncbi:MAG TPA: hypothetical protein PLM79_03595 [Syntrophobacteraceae bacterium]|nr:hypothetical protein [Syntrophobacteraceae bacterium]
MARILLILLLLFIGYRIFKRFSSPGKQVPFGWGDRREGTGDAELVQDPQCGTYFLPGSGVSARIDGRKLTFCSEQCRDDYLKNRSPSKGP